MKKIIIVLFILFLAMSLLATESNNVPKDLPLTLIILLAIVLIIVIFLIYKLLKMEDGSIGKVNFKTAELILGTKNIITARQTVALLNIEYPDEEPVVNYSEKILRQCCEENENGCRWSLIYLSGQNLSEQMNRKGPKILVDPEIEKSKIGLELLQETYESGYHLINLQELFSGMNQEKQSQNIEKLCKPKFVIERCSVIMLAEVIRILYLLKGEKMCHDSNHLGLKIVTNKEEQKFYLRITFDKDTIRIHDNPSSENKDVVLTTIDPGETIPIDWNLMLTGLNTSWD